MGVDAEMLVRNKGRHLTPTEIRDLSVRLAATFGTDAFMIFRPGEFGYTEGAHALRRCPTYAEYKAENYPDEEPWFVDKYGVRPGPEQQVYDQDGPPIIAEEGEQLIRIALAGRYYGEGYERGDPIVYINIAEFLELALPDAAIWYGGDSSGCVAEPFGPAERAKLKAYYFSTGHAPYRGAFGRSGGCRCDFCDLPMNNCGGGGAAAFYHCDGCGLNTVIDGGTRHDLPRHTDFFKWREAVATQQAKEARK